MEITTTVAKTILTPQSAGFLASPPYPFTHSLSAYIGCGFGKTTCGLYCYAQYLPNWTFAGGGMPWGGAVRIKENAPELLEQALGRMRPSTRRRLRVFMSSTTDPYQPAEARYGLTRRCLEVFAHYQDLDLLVIQTRAPLAGRDLDLMEHIPYAWLSVTVETDDQELLRRLRGGPAIIRRLLLVEEARRRGIATQIAVGPCLPYTQEFAAILAAPGAQRIIVDTCVDGDGTGGARTARSPFAARYPAWRDAAPARLLYDTLQGMEIDVGWSTAGFCGIPPRQNPATFLEESNHA